MDIFSCFLSLIRQTAVFVGGKVVCSSPALNVFVAFNELRVRLLNLDTIFSLISHKKDSTTVLWQKGTTIKPRVSTLE